MDAGSGVFAVQLGVDVPGVMAHRAARARPQSRRPRAGPSVDGPRGRASTRCPPVHAYYVWPFAATSWLDLFSNVRT
jgi:hypothetical protein